MLDTSDLAEETSVWKLPANLLRFMQELVRHLNGGVRLLPWRCRCFLPGLSKMLRFSSCCQTRCCVVLIGPITPPDVLVTRSGVRRCCGDVLWLIAGIRWRLWELQHAHSPSLPS